MRLGIDALFQRIYRFFAHGIWTVDLGEVGWCRREVLRLAQLFALLARNFQKDQILLRASALTFTTLLSIVPLLGVMFALLKGFNLHREVMPQILEYLTAGNEESSRNLERLAANVVDYVDQTQVAALGFVSFAIILASVGSLLRASESAFNAIWRTHQARPLFVKIRDYTFIVIITPVLLFVGLSIRQAFSDLTLEPLLIVRGAFEALLAPYPHLSDSASYWLSSLDTLATFGYSTLNLVPLLILWTLFALVYIYAPYTRVPLAAGLLGGLVGAVLWQTAYTGYLSFQFGMVRYNRIYGTLAGLPFTLMWIYTSWVIVLVGAQFSYALHNLESFRKLRRVDTPSPACRERLALRLMATIAANYREGQPATLKGLSQHLEAPEPLTDDILVQLERASLILRAAGADEREPRFLPSRPADEITLARIVAAVRDDGEIYGAPREAKAADLESFLDAGESQARERLDRVTLARFLRDRSQAPTTAAPGVGDVPSVGAPEPRAV